MKNIILIVGFALAAVLFSGAAFYVSFQLSADKAVVEEVVEESEPADPTTFDEMMELAADYREKRRFEPAYGFLRLALDGAETEPQRVEAGWQMGDLLYEDYRQGGASELPTASLYLQAAFASAAGPEQRLQIGKVLLEVLQDAGEKEQFLAYLNKMLDGVSDETEVVDLWRRKFEFLLKQENGWHDMNEALAEAEHFPHQGEAWDTLINDTHLRTKEQLLTNNSWYRSYTEKLALENAGTARVELFEEVRIKLGRRYKGSDWKDQAETLLRLSKAYVAVGNYEQGHDYLKMFLDMEPNENLSEALILFSRISRVRGEMVNAAELAKSLIRRFDFDVHTRDEVLHVIQLLEERGLYEDALELLEGCFSTIDTVNRAMAGLLQRAAVIEERLGHRSNALDYMVQLHDLEVEAMFEATVTELINLNLQRSNYEAVAQLVHLFIPQLMTESDHYNNALFSLFEAKFWLNCPVIEQLYVGAAAVQAAPEDVRAPSVELRMARYIENMRLNDLAIAYYNRIGLLNFFHAESNAAASSQNIGEQAMLGKARCLKRLEDWAAADHLYRELCKRTKSPLIKSEAAVGWGELALYFNQREEARRRFGLAYPQMLSETDQVRYMLGSSLVDEEQQLGDPEKLEENLELLADLSEEARRKSTITFFNDSFDHFFEKGDEAAMQNVIDIACENDLADWLPIQSYMLRLHTERFDHENIEGLGERLREKDEVAGASILELAQIADRLEDQADWITRYKRKAIQ